MSKSKKDPLEGASVSSLRRTINYPPGSSNKRSEDYDGRSSRASSKSSESSPDRKKAKFGKPVARGSDHSFIYDKVELKNISITITNRRAKPPLVQITNPESITPVRRPEYLGRGEESPEYGYHSVASEDRRYEGKRPIFFKSNEGSRSPENRKHEFLEGSSRRKGERKRPETPEYRSRKSRRESPSRRHRRNRSTPSRHSCSSSSSSSSEERRRRKHHFYRMRSERERLHFREQEKRRRDYEMLREIERRQHRPPSPPHPHPHSLSSNGAPKPPNFMRKKEEKPPAKDEEEEVEDPHEEDPAASSSIAVRQGYPLRPPRPPPPFMMRPMRSFVPPFVPPYPPRPGYYPVPHMPPVPFRPMPRGPRPRGFFHP